MLKQTLTNVEFTVDRANSIISQLLNGIPSMKNSASSVVNALFDNIYFDDNSFLHHASFLRQRAFLEQIKRLLETSPGQVLGKLHSLRRQIVTPQTSFAFMATDIQTLTQLFGENASEIWTSFFKDVDNLGDQIFKHGIPTVGVTSIATIFWELFTKPKLSKNLSEPAPRTQRYVIHSENQWRDPQPEYRHGIIGLEGECKSPYRKINTHLLCLL